MRRSIGLYTLSFSLLTGCAGPTTPFGALGLFAPSANSIVDSETAPAPAGRSPRLRFSPSRQVLHTAANFSVVIEDPDGVGEDFILKITYNGLDVTRQFLSHAQRIDLDPIGHEVRFTSKYLRLLPTRENRVKVSYRHVAGSKPVVATYLPPVCSAFVDNQMVFTVPDFEAPFEILQMINQQATRKKINPYFVTGLVAQESGFDPHALSVNKALGLTQVTSIGENEIIKRGGDWPRYPGLDEMSLPILKLSILSGRIDSSNEWRLNPARSIAGGVEYLDYLNDYWSRPEKRAQLERTLGLSETKRSEVILASYNSGAARVSEALDKEGDKYLDSEDLGEAKKYVRKVVSYCDHFEHRED